MIARRFLAALIVLCAGCLLAAAADARGQGGGNGSGMRGSKSSKTEMPAGVDPAIAAAFMPLFANRQAMAERGFFATGLVPVYPEAADCLHVESPFASARRSDGSIRSNRFYGGLHGGMDIPAPDGTPLLAVADGTVIHLSEGGGNIGGLSLILQHAPKDTGLGVWIYTEYKHIRELPDFAIGTRVRRGQRIAETGNTGTTSGHFGDEGLDHLHLTAFWSAGPEFNIGRMLIPVGGQWMDPLAIFRRDGIVDSASLRDLPETAKRVAVPYIGTDGQTVPVDAKVIWPYACSLH
jgi:murein DD-endopeptidase MepM/ murein hydrolase activator NlpD